MGLNLNSLNPVGDTIAALKSLTGDYAHGLVNKTDGTFLRFLAPQNSFRKVTTATALDGAITSGYNYYKDHDLDFYADGKHYIARTNSAGTSLDFTSPAVFSIAKPTSLDVVATENSMKTDQGSPIDGARKFVGAYLQRGVIDNTAVWQTPPWYPSGKVFNQYSQVLHARFYENRAYGFSFDDVPSDPVKTVPAISTCTSMTLVVTSN